MPTSSLRNTRNKMSLYKYIILPCNGLGKCSDIQCYEAKDLYPKKSFNTGEKNTIRVDSQ